MHGRVLDVGCGELFYQQLIARLVNEKKIEYHGLDPDKEALARLRKTGISMTVHNQEVESFQCDPGYFDYVLMLRSINHFRSLQTTFDVITKALRNYGLLIIADCIPFALLRSSEKTRKAHASLKPRFEHYRNFTSQQVLEFVKGRNYPYVVNIHRPVMAKTANLWLIKLIKIDPTDTAKPSGENRWETP